MATQKKLPKEDCAPGSQTKRGINQKKRQRVQSLTLKELESSPAQTGVSVHRTTKNCKPSTPWLSSAGTGKLVESEGVMDGASPVTAVIAGVNVY